MCIIHRMLLGIIQHPHLADRFCLVRPRERMPAFFSCEQGNTTSFKAPSFLLTGTTASFSNPGDHPKPCPCCSPAFLQAVTQMGPQENSGVKSTLLPQAKLNFLYVLVLILSRKTFTPKR